MKNEPVAWMLNGILHECDPSDWAKEQYPDQDVIPLYTHSVKEQSNLVNVVKDHIKDLEECVLILNDSMLVNTANEMKVAIKELKDAIDTQQRPHNTVLVPCDKLAEMQAEIEALKTQCTQYEEKITSWGEIATQERIDMLGAILKKAQE